MASYKQTIDSTPSRWNGRGEDLLALSQAAAEVGPRHAFGMGPLVPSSTVKPWGCHNHNDNHKQQATNRSQILKWILRPKMDMFPEMVMKEKVVT